jgi:polyphenol oxidase
LYVFRNSLGPVELAFTDRHGGVSAPPFGSLNLALDGLDSKAAREENRRRVLDDFAPGARLFDLHQVHGAAVDVVEERRTTDRPDGDALVTARPDAVLMVRAADCVPVLLADPDAGVVGAVHCGRPGLLAGVVPAAVARLRDLGAVSVRAWVGPHVCGGCYEVPPDLQAGVGAVVPESVATTTWGTPSLDLGAGVRAQLAGDGVTVVDVSVCTRESPDLFSYRRDGASAGRQAGLVRLRAGAP